MKNYWLNKRKCPGKIGGMVCVVSSNIGELFQKQLFESARSLEHLKQLVKDNLKVSVKLDKGGL